MSNYNFLTICLVCLTSIAYPQKKQKQIFTEVGIGAFKWSTNSNDLHSHPLIGTVRLGYLMKKNIVLGIEYNYLSYKKSYSKTAPLQQAGSNWIEIGTTTDRYQSMGVFSEVQAQVSSKIKIAPCIFVHYLVNKYYSKGIYYQDGIPTGITVISGTDFGYFARAGASLSFSYCLSSSTTITARCLEIENRFRKNGGVFFFAIPAIIGVQYYFMK